MRVHAQASEILRGRGISAQHRFLRRSRYRRPSGAHRGVARREAGGRAVVAIRIQPLVLRGARRTVEAASLQFPRRDAEYVESQRAGGQSVSTEAQVRMLAGLLGGSSRAASAVWSADRGRGYGP